jgi:hypothetical protein
MRKSSWSESDEKERAKVRQRSRPELLPFPQLTFTHTDFESKHFALFNLQRGFLPLNLSILFFYRIMDQ